MTAGVCCECAIQGNLVGSCDWACSRGAAAIGTLGELIRASSRDEPIHTYRNKEYGFFERAFRQHTGVREVTRLYDRLYQLHRRRGLSDFTVVLVDVYDVSAEDIRHVRDLYGRFDAAVKITSYE